VTVVVDFDKASQMCEPWVETRGWLDADDATKITREIVTLVSEAIDKELANPDWDRASLTRRVRRATGTCVNVRSRRRPMIIAVVIDT